MRLNQASALFRPSLPSYATLRRTTIPVNYVPLVRRSKHRYSNVPALVTTLQQYHILLAIHNLLSSPFLLLLLLTPTTSYYGGNSVLRVQSSHFHQPCYSDLTLRFSAYAILPFLSRSNLPWPLSLSCNPPPLGYAPSHTIAHHTTKFLLNISDPFFLDRRTNNPKLLIRIASTTLLYVRERLRSLVLQLIYPCPWPSRHTTVSMSALLILRARTFNPQGR